MVLRKYHNFNAALNRKQTTAAQVTIFLKLIFCFLIAFQWVFVRLAPSAVTYYPNYLILSDCVHLFSWVCLYQKPQRSLGVTYLSNSETSVNEA